MKGSHDGIFLQSTKTIGKRIGSWSDDLYPQSRYQGNPYAIRGGM